MKKITSYVYDFESMIKGNFLYVDKTEYIWKLIKKTGESYFLSRPRRFGKSLTLSTLKAVFEGKKELFKGLAIYDKPYDWKPYPVIHISFADYSASMDTPEKFIEYLNAKLRRIERQFALSLEFTDPVLGFGDLIERLSEKEEVVVLVDEYDKPILDNISNPEIEHIREVLSGFYSVLKDQNAVLRCLFVTGVTKFCHMAMYTSMSTLNDISMTAGYATMLGYTQEELDQNFGEYIDRIAAEQNVSSEELKGQLKDWYNGYRFEEDAERVYNPVAVAKFFENNGEFRHYWSSTGSTSLLFEGLLDQKVNLEKKLASPISEYFFNAFEIERIDPLILMYQTGYLTIDHVERKGRIMNYQLCYPNYEVRDSFLAGFISACSNCYSYEVRGMVSELMRFIAMGDVDGFMETMKACFVLQQKSENHFQMLFYSIFMLLGCDIQAEACTSSGCIDAVAEDQNHVFIFEFKLDKAADIALKQIREKDYFRRYMNSGKQITLIGVRFDMEQGQISDWTYEEAGN